MNVMQAFIYGDTCKLERFLDEVARRGFRVNEEYTENARCLKLKFSSSIVGVIMDVVRTVDVHAEWLPCERKD